jgi:hypothetical protein
MTTCVSRSLFLDLSCHVCHGHALYGSIHDLLGLYVSSLL